MGVLHDSSRPRAARGTAVRGAAALIAAGAAMVGSVSVPASAIVTSNNFLPIQALVGADRFYDFGFYGFGAVIANVEAGHVWEKHEVFANPVGPGTYFVQDPSLFPIFPQRQYDFHATAVGSILTGIGPFTPGIGYFYYQFGMAPGATLISSAIATDWVGNTGEFNISKESFNSGYTIPMRDGVFVEIFGPGTGIQVQVRADVVNSSWGFDDPAGTSQEAMTIDALIDRYRQTFCYAAGNHDSGTPQVLGPASGFNGIAVGALGSDLSNPPYNQIAPFSNIGLNNFHNPKKSKDFPGIVPAVDIAAPGTDLVVAAYTGSTGTFTGLVDPAPGQTDLYYVGVDGTSFASPIVAGGAALLIGAGKDVFGFATKATDSLTVKAVLLNSARKTPGWTNYSNLIDGVYTTTYGLDMAVGAGAADFSRAIDQYFFGNVDLPGTLGGTIQNLGWDYGNVHLAQPNDYFFLEPLAAGDTFTATLTWMMHRTFNDATGNSAESFFNDLDLQLWRVENGQLTTLIGESNTMFNNVEHLYMEVPQTGQYALRVYYYANTFDLTALNHDNEDYALAWAVPEPTSLLPCGLALLSLRRRRRARHL